MANAYAYGLGPSRRVVFWDTMLVEPFTEASRRSCSRTSSLITRRTTSRRASAWFAIFAVPGAWILMRATRGRGGMGRPEAVPLALLVVAVIQLAAAPAQNSISRRMEAEADWKALELTRDPASLERRHGRLSRTSLGDPDPPGWVQPLLGTHPALADRVAMADAWTRRTAQPEPWRGQRVSLGRGKPALGQRVLGARAALGRREPAALGGDRPALDAVRGRHLTETIPSPRSARPRTRAPGTSTSTPPRPVGAHASRPRGGSAGRRASGFPTRRPRRACRRRTCRPASDSAPRDRS